MGYGPVVNGKHTPITPWEGSWAATVNQPIPESVKQAFRDQHVATSGGSIRLPGTYDRQGRKLS